MLQCWRRVARQSRQRRQQLMLQPMLVLLATRQQRSQARQLALLCWPKEAAQTRRARQLQMQPRSLVGRLVPSKLLQLDLRMLLRLVALEAMARHHSLQLLWQGVLLVLWRMGQLVVVVVASVALAAMQALLPKLRKRPKTRPGSRA